jgi:preprotein translocase subunit SecA
MLSRILGRIFRSSSSTARDRLAARIPAIRLQAESLHGLGDPEIQERVAALRERVRAASSDLDAEAQRLEDSRHETADSATRRTLAERADALRAEATLAARGALDEVADEALALGLEACRRLSGREIEVLGQPWRWDMVPYDVQLQGALALHEGRVAQMATGEGKTLVAALALYLNALAGRGAHLITANDYLARRDAAWMGHLFARLGLRADCIHLYPPASPERALAYRADVVYGSKDEVAADYLRDHVVGSPTQRVQTPFFYAIVDEADQVLIDEGRIPVVLSRSAESPLAPLLLDALPRVAEAHRVQSERVEALLAEAERAVASGDTDAAIRPLVLARRGSPRHPRLRALLSERPGLQGPVFETQMRMQQDGSLLAADEALCFVVDEDGLGVHFTERGSRVVTGGRPEELVVPDLDEMRADLLEDPDLDEAEIAERLAAAEREGEERIQRYHATRQLARAFTLFHRDVDYVVHEDRIVLIEQSTGRAQPGRRWSDGLHQAVEAREGLSLSRGSVVEARVTMQNFVRLYPRLAGMTGTARGAEDEFEATYGTPVVRLPTHRPLIRDDRPDLIYRTLEEKYEALVTEIGRLHRLGLPVLVGTASVESSERLSRMLRARGVAQELLNARNHEREAEIVALAGQPGAVTLSTNMAGRGTDIRLAEACLTDREGETGGLRVLGSERHESARIDDQLRGRAGRQGDPGVTQFYVALEDDLLRRFGGAGVGQILSQAGTTRGHPVSHPLLDRWVAEAQRRVEREGRQERVRLLAYDDLVTRQREHAYALRDEILSGGRVALHEAWDLIETHLDRMLEDAAPGTGDPPQPETLRAAMREAFGADVTAAEIPDTQNRPEMRAWARSLLRGRFDAQVQTFAEAAAPVASRILLHHLDRAWASYLAEMEDLRASVLLQTWGQKDPVALFRAQAFDAFEEMQAEIAAEVSTTFLKAAVVPASPTPP